eukprot:5334317-Alexandrium_andersonii.AAC.1
MAGRWGWLPPAQRTSRSVCGGAGGVGAKDLDSSCVDAVPSATRAPQGSKPLRSLRTQINGIWPGGASRWQSHSPLRELEAGDE